MEKSKNVPKDGMKICRKCGKELPLSDFYYSAYKGAYMSPCRLCRCASARERQRKQKVEQEIKAQLFGAPDVVVDASIEAVQEVRLHENPVVRALYEVSCALDALEGELVKEALSSGSPVVKAQIGRVAGMKAIAGRISETMVRIK